MSLVAYCHTYTFPESVQSLSTFDQKPLWESITRLLARQTHLHLTNHLRSYHCRRPLNINRCGNVNHSVALSSHNSALFQDIPRKLAHQWKRDVASQNISIMKTKQPTPYIFVLFSYFMANK